MGQTLEEFRYIALQLKKDRSGTERLIKPIVDRFNKLKAT